MLLLVLLKTRLPTKNKCGRCRTNFGEAFPREAVSDWHVFVNHLCGLHGESVHAVLSHELSNVSKVRCSIGGLRGEHFKLFWTQREGWRAPHS